jgi:hypothetical protein
MQVVKIKIQCMHSTLLANLLQKIRSFLVLTEEDYLLVGSHVVATSVPEWNKGFYSVSLPP